MAGADRSRKSEIQELMDRVLTQCPEILRRRWCPMRIPGAIYDTQNTKLNSKFGGDKPFRPDNFKWPACDFCGRKKAFVCQLNIETLPVEFQEKIKFSSGLFQLFYCFECIQSQVVELETKRKYSTVNIVQKSEFVPSLMSLAAEAFAKRKSSDMNDLPRKLREYVENFTESAPATGSREKVVINWRKELEVVNEFDFNIEFAPNIRFLTMDEREEFQHTLTMEYPDPSSIYGEEIRALEYWSITHNNINVRDDHFQTKIGGWIGSTYSTEPPECPDCGEEMDTNFLHENEDWFTFSSIAWVEEIDVYFCSKCTKFSVQVQFEPYSPEYSVDSTVEDRSSDESSSDDTRQ